MNLKFGFCSLVALLFFFSCTNNEAEIKALQKERDSLQALTFQKDSAVNIFIQSVNEIEQNLAEIKQKEGIININKGNEVTTSKKDQINKDILSIYDLLRQNKTKLRNAQMRLKSSGLNIDQLNLMVEQLNYKIAIKDSNIAHLRMQLSQLDLLVDSLFQNIDSLYFENELKDEIIDFQRAKLNKAYYIIGSKKELLEQEVIDKKGGFVGLKRIKQLREDFNKDNFTEIDITQKISFPLYAPTVEVITNHPSGAYQMHGESPVDSLVITDIEDFWSISKYLVIVIEQ